MGTYKGNAGHLMQHWTLCELLTAAGRHDTPGLNYIDAHAMAPLARVREKANRRFDIVQQRVQVCLPDPHFAYEHAWHHLKPNEGYPNSAAFVREVWKGQVSMLLCETDECTVTDLKAWVHGRARAEIAEGDWRDRFDKGLPSPSKVGLPDGSLTLVSFDPDMYDRRRLDARNPRNLYPGDLELTLRALDRVGGGVLIQLSTYSRGRGNENPQPAVIDSVDAILMEGGFTLASVVRLNGNMMSLVYALNVAWWAQLENLPDRFTRWLNEIDRQLRSSRRVRGNGNI